MEPIFHIAAQPTWEAAVAVGEYAQSTRDQTLDEVGFIHCSYRRQVDGVLANFYADVTEPLVLLTIDPDRVQRRIQVDDGFPHIYGPLNTDAVVEVAPIYA